MPGMLCSAQLMKFRQEDDGAVLHLRKSIDVVPGSSTRYGSLRWPTTARVFSALLPAAAAAGPLGEAEEERAGSEEANADPLSSRRDGCLLAAKVVAAAKAGEVSAPLIKTTAPRERVSNDALDVQLLQGSDPTTTPVGKMSNKLAVIASLISEYERMVREIEVALKQVETWAAFCFGVVKLHETKPEDLQQRDELLFAMVMANNYVEMRKAGVS